MVDGIYAVSAISRKHGFTGPLIGEQVSCIKGLQKIAEQPAKSKSTYSSTHAKSVKAWSLSTESLHECDTIVNYNDLRPSEIEMRIRIDSIPWDHGSIDVCDWIDEEGHEIYHPPTSYSMHAAALTHPMCPETIESND